jgi:photosystem II stability/assembly factor-like uncharacterized protein
MYVVATAGTVEFDVVGFVEEASPAARERAVRDVSYVAVHEAGHVNHLLALGSLGPPAASGLAWHSLPNPDRGKLNHDLADVSCPSATVCYAVGYSTLATTNGGASWQVQAGSPTHYLNGIACPSVTTCVAVGGAGTIVATTDGGATWHAQPSGTARNLYGVACASSAACVAVGERGTILTTSDGGQTWTSRRNLDSGKVNHDFISVACPRVGVCYAVGYSTVATTDGGVSWQAQAGSSTFYLFGIACWRPRACLATGERGTIVGTTDGGSTWTNRSSGTRLYLHRVFCTSAGACLVVGQNGTIRSTADGGMSWRAQASGTTMTLWSVTCTPVGRCYAVGDKGTILVRS